MHSVTLYCKGSDQQDVAVATARVTDDATLEVRLMDDTILSSVSLEEWGNRQLLLYLSPSNTHRVRIKRVQSQR